MTLLFGAQAVDPNSAFATAEPAYTLREEFSRNDAVILARRVAADEDAKSSRGTATFEIVEVRRSPSKLHVPGARIVLDFYHPGKPGALALLMGTTTTPTKQLSLYRPIDVTDVSYGYITNAPGSGASLAKRLSYYAKFLEHDEPLIAKDAFKEFENVDFMQLARLAELLPREQLRRWVLSAETPGNRIALYGRMLGLCGRDEDALEIEKRFVLANPIEYRFGTDGVLAGYLMLTGERGLALIEDTRVKPRETVFGEAYSAVAALEFCRQYGTGKISPARIASSMSLFLDRPDMADLAIYDLARWREWSVQDRLIEMYGAPDFDTLGVKRAIIRYMFASIADVPKDADEKRPEHAVNGIRYLQQLRERDAKIVTDVEKRLPSPWPSDR